MNRVELAELENLKVKILKLKDDIEKHNKARKNLARRKRNLSKQLDALEKKYSMEKDNE